MHTSSFNEPDKNQRFNTTAKQPRVRNRIPLSHSRNARWSVSDSLAKFTKSSDLKKKGGELDFDYRLPPRYRFTFGDGSLLMRSWYACREC